MKTQLSESVVLVTGGSSRLGSAIATAFSEEGAAVAITYAGNRDAAQRAADDVTARGGRASIHQYDMTRSQSADELVLDVTSTHGRLDIVVANALRWPDSGPGPRSEPFDEGGGDWVHELHANTFGPAALSRAVLPSLRRSGQGRLIFIGTSTLRHPVRGEATYLAAKSSLTGLAVGLAWDAGGDGVTANIVVPGWIVDLDSVPETFRPELERLAAEHAAQAPLGRLVTATDVAAAVVFLASPLARSITGETLAVTAGF